MGITIFSSDIQNNSEEMYQNWLRDHENGFVVNLLKSAKTQRSKSDVRFTRIHKASCKSINPLESNFDKSGFTTGRYQKACTLTLEDAEKEGCAQTGLASIKCCPCV
ncbi:hypothetical protein PGS49_21145 [Yersinia intermedia]|uniref:hypothetical protein n=1 Tax=Yersinia intermedia TaxID=631 RepID=UPI0022FF065F|nr:hypothetical protein [Yersinia intermedia]MDA5483128.1 hypothetical protein [Yersinia intermedia]